MRKTGTLVILRHGESQYNKEDRWAGWVDTPLTPKGEKDAYAGGQQIKAGGFVPDAVYATPLCRARETAKQALAAMGMTEMPLRISKALMERHYGGLTGLNKMEMKAKLGDRQFTLYRRSYAEPLPAMEPDHPHHPDNSSKELKVIGMPPNGKKAESLADVVERVKPFWEKELLPRLQKGENVLITAHGNSLRALSMVIEGMTPEQVEAYEIANATPIMLTIESAPGEKTWKFTGKRILKNDANKATA